MANKFGGKELYEPNLPRESYVGKEMKLDKINLLKKPRAGLIGFGMI